MKSFANKTVVVTGAGSGIGRALALELSHRGACLALSDVNEGGLERTKELILNDHPDAKVHTYVVDVADQAAMKQFSNDVSQKFPRVNVLINNAGVALSARLEEVSRDDFEWLMNINFWGVVNGCEAFLPLLKASGNGHIANLSSVFGLMSLPKQGTYNASKFAVRGYTEALRQEMIVSKSPVGVSCVHPGGIATDIARNARMDADDVKQDMAATFDKLAHTSPEKAAKVILKGIQKNKARVLIGPDAYLIHFLVRLLGAKYQLITQYLATKLGYH